MAKSTERKIFATPGRNTPYGEKDGPAASTFQELQLEESIKHISNYEYGRFKLRSTASNDVIEDLVRVFWFREMWCL